YNTLYGVAYFDQEGERHDLGGVKIGQFNMLFRLKSPRNVIGGFGVFSHASKLPISLAWEAFGIKNGARSFAEMRERIGRLRSREGGPLTDYVIGARILVQPVFLPEHLWIPQPESWSGPIVVGKTYSTEDREGLRLWERVMEAAQLAEAPQAGFGEQPARRYGEPTLIRPRLGQGAFRVSVTDAYSRKCAVSGGKVLPALEAAHIRPYREGGQHEVSNGILMRRDIHSVFDAGYVTVDEDHRLVVSDRVRTEFNNGEEYQRMHGAKLILPSSTAHQPDVEALRWHNERVFRD
ncbi:MAG: HNH endonuclease, partial [Alphaproteobacteria bacterium]